jgi:hypothetical protein
MKTTLLIVFMVLATAVSLFALNSKILAQDSGSMRGPMYRPFHGLSR